MLNRTPPNKPANTSSVISSYRKRRMQSGPMLLYGAIGLIVIGLILVVVWLFQPNQMIGAMLATDTPTPTSTYTPTSTSTPTATGTATETPTITITPTRSGPVDYIIQEGDSLPAIAEKYGLGNEGVLLIIDANPTIVANNGVYFVGQSIVIPPPGSTLPTSTPIPASVPRGTKIDYKVMPGDTLAGIAAKFNSKTDDIITANKITDANALNVGDILKIPVNLVTSTPTLPPTSTPVTPTIEGQPTQTPVVPTTAPSTGSTTTTTSASCTATGNDAFVTELQTLINNERTKNGLAALTVNPKLTSSATSYATEMLCNNYLSPTGLDGSTAKSRAAVQGYSASVIFEDIYALQPVYGITPQVAFNWWMKDPVSKASLLSPDVTEIGVAYVSNENTLFGAYFVATFAKP